MVRNLDETMLRGEEEVVYENTLALVLVLALALVLVLVLVLVLALALALVLAMLAQELVRLTQGLVVAEVCSLAEEADLR